MRQFCCQIYYGIWLKVKCSNDKMRHFIKRYENELVELVVFGENVA